MGIIRGGDAEYDDSEPTLEEKTGKMEAAITAALSDDLATLKLSGKYLGADEALILSRSERLKTVRTLDLSDNQIPDEGLVALFQSDNLSGVTSLNLGINFITGKGVQDVAQLESPAMTHLKSLTLSDNRVTDSAGAELVRSPHFQELEVLDLGWNEIGNETAAALGQTGTLPKLRRGYIDAEGIRGLLGGKVALGLRELNLSANKLNDEAIGLLAGFERWASLEVLRVSQNLFGDEGAKALGESAGLAGLTQLYMGRNAFGPEGAKAVYETKTLTNLKTLMLKEGVETTPGLVNYSRPELLRPEDP